MKCGWSYRRANPPPHWARWAGEIWEQRHPAIPEDRVTRILPTGLVDLVINRGDPFERVGGDPFKPLPSIHVAGLQTRPLLVRATGLTDLIVIRLWPWALPRLLGVAAVELADRIVAGDELGIRPGRRWPYVEVREPKRQRHRSVAEAAMSIIRRRSGQISVAALAARLQISRRQLARLFRHQIGCPPSLVTSIIRFQAALGKIGQGEPAATVAADAGFSDQAHMIRHFSRFSGLTPCQVAKCSTTMLHQSFNRSGYRCRSFNTTYL